MKIRGHRVELDEVAAAIRVCGWSVACVFRRGETLAALVEAIDGRSFDEGALRRALRGHLEQYAIPQNIAVIARMPRNDNDKIERAAAARRLDEFCASFPQ